MLKKIRNLSNLDNNAINLLVKFLSKHNIVSQVINLLLNISYKLRLKFIRKNQIKHSQKFTGDLDKIFSNPNSYLFLGNVLLVAELSIAPCKKYRVTQKADMLKLLGYNVDVVSWCDSSSVYNKIKTAGIIIFYRVPAFDSVKDYYKIAKKIGVVTYYDIDDLIFDRQKLSQNESLSHLPSSELDQLYKGAELYLNALQLADFGIASTKCLSEEMYLKTNKPTYVLHNAIDTQSLQIGESIISKHERCRIVYGSGTNTHNADFAIVSETILQVLSKYKNVDFVIYGYLDLDDRFNAFSEQILRVPFVDAEYYYRALASCDIAIAPLTQNIFNDCKSNIKFLESSLYKIPSVCSPLAEFVDIICHEHNGFIANNTEEWFNSLSALVVDKNLRRSIGEQAYLDVINRYDWQYIAKTELAQFLPDIVSSDKTKRILLVNVLYKPDSFGGATIIVEESAKELMKQGFEVLVFCGSFDDNIPFGSYERYDIDGISVVCTRVAYHADKSLEFNNPANESIFEQLILGFKPEIVHFHSIQLLGANLAYICKSNSIPYVITLHDAWWFCERQFMINSNKTYCNNEEGLLAKCASCVENSAFNHKRRFYLYDVFNNAKLLLTPSQFQKELYIKAGFGHENICVNKNGVLPARNIMKLSNACNDKIVFAYLGGNAEHKGFSWLNDIFSKVSSNFILRLVNLESRMGSNINYLSLLKDIPSNKCQVTPFFNQENIDEFFADVDVLLFPSQCKESFGLTIREAMLRDVWVISTDCGGPVEDICDGVNGNIVEFGNKSEFIRIVQGILDNVTYYKGYTNKDKTNIRLINEQISELIDYYNGI